MSRRAAIDIGTNSVRLLVADIADSRRSSPRLLPVLRRLEITRLGERLTPGGRIHPNAAARTAAAVEQFAALSADAGVPAPLLVGTHALRAAQNPDALLSRLHHPVRILTSDEEARLGFWGVLAALGPFPPGSKLLVVDIGGGSIELTWGSRGRIQGSFCAPAGAVVLTERFLAHDPPRPEEIAALRDHLARTIGHDLSLPSGSRLRAVGVGGTITTLAAIEQRLSPYDPDRVHGYRLSRRAVDRMAEVLLASTVAERRRLPGLQPERADIIAGGTLILQYLLARVGADSVTVSEADLLWALLLDQVPSSRPSMRM